MSFEKSTVKIPSVTPGWNLDAWIYVPTGRTGPHPVIIMAHGWSANKMMSIAEYAEVFAMEGYACVLFDYRRWGASDGSPRHLLQIPDQHDDYRTVIKYVRQQTQFDEAKILLFGTSFAGGHVISLASEASLNLKAVIAQCPYTGTTAIMKPNLALLQTVCYAVVDWVKQTLGLQPVYMKAATPGPSHPGGLTTEGSEQGIGSLCKERKDWPNEVNAGIMLRVPFYKPYSTAASIHCPTLLVSPVDDKLCTIEGADIVAKRSTNVELVKIEKSGHFDIYPGRKDYDFTLKTELDFLKKHVPL